MEHPIFFLVVLCEKIGLGDFAHHYPWVLYMWLMMAVLIILGILGAKGVRMVPTKAQNFFEILIGGIEEFTVDVAGEEIRRFFPVLATIFIFIFISNLSGLVPGFFPPTAAVNTTLACAITAVVMTHIIGFQFHGAKYYKHFIGPIWWMAPLICPIELIGHTARLLSLSIRLFGNMAGHELVLGILFMLAGMFFAPLPIMALGIFVALVQAFVFFLLTTIYFSGSIEHAH
jgi:F-type H+-transporting ATPase subunit a